MFTIFTDWNFSRPPN